MNDEQLMEHMLDVLHAYYQQNSFQMRDIGKIRDVLERKTGARIRLDQLTQCGMQLSERGYIRIKESHGKNPIQGWDETIILQNGITHIHKRTQNKKTQDEEKE